MFGICLFRLVSLALVATIALLFLPYALSYVDGWDKYPYLKKTVAAQVWLVQTSGAWIRQYVPTQIKGADRTVWFLAGAGLLGIFFSGRITGHLADRAEAVRLRRGVEAWKKQMGLAQNARVTKELNEKLAGLDHGKKADREELLRIFAETKRKLEGMGRELAFLSLDIVGSTQMKVGEEQGSIEHDFKQYKAFVTEIFQANGVLKSAWTPDGQMACFSNIDTAVKAGKDVIRGLVRFNREIKLMKTEFVVRCGVNSGYVHMDDSAPLEEINDRVIDIAGHMQKHSEPNTVAVAKPVVEPMTDREGFRETTQVVDGYQVYVWRPGEMK